MGLSIFVPFVVGGVSIFESENTCIYVILRIVKPSQASTSCKILSNAKIV